MAQGGGGSGSAPRAPPASLLSIWALRSGDNDPLDIVEIGTKQWAVGSIVRVKVLGVLAMIDSGETDWKLIAINCEDPYADMLNDVDDVDVHMPGATTALHRWLRFYKTPTINEFGFNGRYQNRAFAESIVEETHHQWEKLVEERGKAPVLAPHAH
jgi:inorganic pyrophosphatase